MGTPDHAAGIPRPDSRARRIVLATTIAAFVLVALLAVFALELADTQASSKQDVRTRVHERATLAVALIDSLFQSTELAAPAQARTYGAATVPDRLLEASRQTNTYLALYDAGGRVLANSKGFTPAERADLARSPSLAIVRRGAPYGIGNVHRYGRTSVIDLAVGLRTRSGPRVLVTGFSPKTLNALFGSELRKIPGVKGALNYLIDGADTVITSTNPKRPAGYVITKPGSVNGLAKPSGTADGRYYVQVRLANSPWHLLLTAPEDRLFAGVSGVRKWVPWVIFGAFALVAAVAFLLGRRALSAGDQLRDTNAELADVNQQVATANAALQRRASELARSNDELNQFASIASHDLQEPLRKVRTFTEQLTVMEADRLSEKGQDYLRRTNASAERMQRLIEDLLRFSRVSTQTRPFAPVDLDEVTREVLTDLELEIERAGAHVVVGELPTIRGDGSQLRQLLQNLLSNALKFRREGVRHEVHVDGEVGGDWLTLVVRDNGIGFEPRYSQRIFRVFERLHGRSTYAGTGIGLALCRKIVERHGGTITADGRPDAGSTFSVRLPVAQPDEVVTVHADDDDAPHPATTEDAVHA